MLRHAAAAVATTPTRPRHRYAAADAFMLLLRCCHAMRHADVAAYMALCLLCHAMPYALMMLIFSYAHDMPCYFRFRHTPLYAMILFSFFADTAFFSLRHLFFSPMLMIID